MPPLLCPDINGGEFRVLVCIVSQWRALIYQPKIDLSMFLFKTASRLLN